MAIEYEVSQSTREEKVYPLDFSPALLEGVEVTDITFEYTGDNEDDEPPLFDVSTIDTPIAYVTVSGLVVGVHRLRCLATTDNDDLSPEIVLQITTNF